MADIQSEVLERLQSDIQPLPVELPKAVDHSSQAPRALFSTRDDYVTATRRLIDHKKLREALRQHLKAHGLR